MQQDPCPELFPVEGLRVVRLAVVDRQPSPEIQQKTVLPEVLPDAAGIRFAGISLRVDRETQVRPDVAMPEFIARREYQFGVYIDAALPRVAAPHVIRIMVQYAEPEFMDPGAFVLGLEAVGKKGISEENEEQGNRGMRE